MVDDLKRGVKRKIEENLTRIQTNGTTPNATINSTNGITNFSSVNRTLSSDANLHNSTSNTNNNGVISATKRKIMNASEIDRKRILHPDYFHSFSSFDDSWFKLLSYHLFLFPSSEAPSQREEVLHSRCKYIKKDKITNIKGKRKHPIN